MNTKKLFFSMLLMAFVITVNSQNKNLLIFSPDIENMQELLFGIEPNSAIQILDNLDAPQNLSDLLDANPDIEAIHLLVKGDRQEVLIGGTKYANSGVGFQNYITNLLNVMTEKSIKKLFIYSSFYASSPSNIEFIINESKNRDLSIYATAGEFGNTEGAELIFNYSVENGMVKSVDSNISNVENIKINFTINK
ncbi:DUF4347 domain-containing protein [Saccharicrinis sp. FJH2]|uniref:DUF4347 domain-containing protein n=1 Tax=Saccharicrinis sp. FJH65 TaxID=3344659 RepID=UPI0035F32767